MVLSISLKVGRTILIPWKWCSLGGLNGIAIVMINQNINLIPASHLTKGLWAHKETYCSYIKHIHHFRLQLCTCDDHPAIVAFVSLWLELVNIFNVKATWNHARFLWCVHISLVTWVPGPKEMGCVFNIISYYSNQEETHIFGRNLKKITFYLKSHYPQLCKFMLIWFFGCLCLCLALYMTSLSQKESLYKSYIYNVYGS